MVTNVPTPPVTQITWSRATRIIRSIYPPIDLFEDIADPEDWALLVSAEQKTNPRLMETIGTLDLVPEDRRVGGPGASYLMAPFTHTSPDRPSRFSDGQLGVLYIADTFETAVEETAHHHAAFMAATNEAPGWTSQFREILMDVDAPLHDLRGEDHAPALDPDSYAVSQPLAQSLRAQDSQGIVYPSARCQGTCLAVFFPDLASNPIQARHLDYHWDGTRVDLIRDTSSNQVYRLVPEEDA